LWELGGNAGEYRHRTASLRRDVRLPLGHSNVGYQKGLAICLLPAFNAIEAFADRSEVG
jgi:hypothetical protein